MARHKLSSSVSLHSDFLSCEYIYAITLDNKYQNLPKDNQHVNKNGVRLQDGLACVGLLLLPVKTQTHFERRDQEWTAWVLYKRVSCLKLTGVGSNILTGGRLVPVKPLLQLELFN